MSEPRQSGAANTAAALARLEEQVATLQRERKEDRQRWSDDLRQFQTMLERVAPAIKEQVEQAIAPLADDLAKVTAATQANSTWIMQVKAQGAVWGVVLVSAGSLLAWIASHLVSWWTGGSR